MEEVEGDRDSNGKESHRAHVHIVYLMSNPVIVNVIMAMRRRISSISAIILLRKVAWSTS